MIRFAVDGARAAISTGLFELASGETIKAAAYGQIRRKQSCMRICVDVRIRRDRSDAAEKRRGAAPRMMTTAGPPERRFARYLYVL